MLRIPCWLVLASLGSAATPPYFATVANSVLRMRGGATLGPLDTAPIMRLEQQVKRVLGADPSQPLNVSDALALREDALLKILLLAVLGNFTSSAAASWQQPCSILVDPEDGRFVREDGDGQERSALIVVVLLLMLVEFGRWAQASLAQIRAESDAPRGTGKTL